MTGRTTAVQPSERRAVTEPATSVAGLLNQAADLFPDNEALVAGDRRLTYRELRAEADALASGLLAAGVSPGDRVCLFAPNIVEAYVALFATAKSGAVFVPVNPRLTERELRAVLSTSRATALLFVPEYNGIDYVERLRGIYPQLAGDPALDATLLVALRGTAPASMRYDDLTLRGAEPTNASRQAAIESAVRPDDPALLQFTSGTTAAPKAAVLAHGPTARMSFELGRRFGLSSADRYFGCPPICHLGGTTFSLLSAVTHGSTFVTLPVFEAGLALETMEREGCTVDHGIDSHLRLQIAHPTFDPARLALRLVSVSALAQTVQDVARAFGDGVVVISQYGSTELGAAPVCASFDDPAEKRLGTVGRALPGIALDVVDPDSGAAVDGGQVGEIRIGGWSLMAGYLDAPEETAKILDESGRLRTGDLGYLDPDRYLHFTGRLKNLLRSGGENVSLEELESVITDFDGVDVAVVVGVPDDRLGEVGYAFVGSDRPGQVDAEELRAHCLGQLAKFKVPKYFTIGAVADIPISGNGKFDRRALEARAIELRDKA